MIRASDIPHDTASPPLPLRATDPIGVAGDSGATISADYLDTIPAEVPVVGLMRVPTGGAAELGTDAALAMARREEALASAPIEPIEGAAVVRETVSESNRVAPAGMVGAVTSGTTLADKLGKRLIVLAMDDSAASSNALAWSLKQMIHPERDHLVVLTVANYKSAGFLHTNESKTLRRELKAEERAQRIVDYAATHVAQFVEAYGVPLSFELVTLKAADGNVRDVILDYVRDIGASMLLVGSHAGGALRKAIIGSTATYLLNHCNVPVIVVREQGGVNAG